MTQEDEGTLRGYVLAQEAKRRAVGYGAGPSFLPPAEEEAREQTRTPQVVHHVRAQAMRREWRDLEDRYGDLPEFADQLREAVEKLDS